jgi:predicted lactoylglutathione lyase
MSNDVWINLPVNNLSTSGRFFTAIGFIASESDGNSNTTACFVIGDKKVILMLYLVDHFPVQPVFDTTKGVQVLFSLGAESRDRVDELAAIVEKAGGTVVSRPQAHGPIMYGCSFADPDGHRWNVLYM